MVEPGRAPQAAKIQVSFRYLLQVYLLTRPSRHLPKHAVVYTYIPCLHRVHAGEGCIALSPWGRIFPLAARAKQVSPVHGAGSGCWFKIRRVDQPGRPMCSCHLPATCRNRATNGKKAMFERLDSNCVANMRTSEEAPAGLLYCRIVGACMYALPQKNSHFRCAWSSTSW